MPRNVRNFWFDAYMPGTGRKPVGTGPAKANGSIEMHFFIREKGSVAPAFSVIGTPGAEGKLHLRIDLKHPDMQGRGNSPLSDKSIYLITER